MDATRPAVTAVRLALRAGHDLEANGDFGTIALTVLKALGDLWAIASRCQVLAP